MKKKKFIPVLVECNWRLCDKMFMPKTFKSKYCCDEHRLLARYEREKEYGLRCREQTVKKQEDLKKINSEKTTLCTCPMCRETHEVIGIVKPAWKYCTNCDNVRENTMNGVPEDYGSVGHSHTAKRSHS